MLAISEIPFRLFAFVDEASTFFEKPKISRKTFLI